jgi:chromosome segregation and condensation protein ScpB
MDGKKGAYNQSTKEEIARILKEVQNKISRFSKRHPSTSFCIKFTQGVTLTEIKS